MIPRLLLLFTLAIVSAVADYPASPGKPALHHEDLMMFYKEAANDPMQAIYVDSEGHAIHYQAESGPGMVRFVSHAGAGAPGYRLTYRDENEEIDRR